MKIKIILRLAGWLSFLPLSVLRLFGLFIGIAGAWLNIRAIRVSRINLGIAHPDMSKEEIERISRLRLRHMGKISLETLKIWRKGYQWSDKKIIDIEGIEHFEAA